MIVTYQICNCCGENKKLESYYSSSAFFMKHNGKVHTCKQCVWDYVGANEKEIEMPKVKMTMRMLDKAFIYDLWMASINEASTRDGSAFKFYMKNLGMKQYRDFTWDDSQFYSATDFTVNNDIVIYTEDHDHSTQTFDPNDLKRLSFTWGKFSETDYIFLENFYGEYKNNFPTDTPAQVNIYKNLAKIHLQAEKELAKGNIRGYKDLMDLSSKMHTDGMIKPMQSSGMNDDKGLSTYGLWIKTIEQDEPCEYFEDKPTYADYDGFKKYIDKWFIRPFKNIFNLSKDFDVKDDD